LRYDDFFATPGEHRSSNTNGDPIESNIESEKVSLYYKPNQSDKIEKELSRFQKEHGEKLKEIQEAEKGLLAQDENELSKHQQKQHQLANKIKRLEEENIKTKSWIFSGETQANQRPINSLLEEELDYEFASKLPPLITEEVTKSIEEIICFRIQENAFDDVIKKELVKEEKRREITLDSTKSKKSLAEIYEEDFIKATKSSSSSQGKKGETTGVEQSKKWDDKQRNTLRFYKRIFDQLDALVGVENPINKD